MYVAEQIRLKEDVVCPEKTKPQVQEHCIIRTLNRADGLFEAEFSLELTGVMAGKVDNESHDLKRKKHAENYMGMLLSSLSDGEALEFRYCWDNGSACEDQFRLLISGRCLGHDGELTTRKALNLYHGLNTALGASAREYRFTSTMDWPGDEEHCSLWRHELRPLGLIIPATKLRLPGFVAPESISENVLLPLRTVDPSVRFNAGITGGACYQKITLLVTVESTRLSDDAAATISAAILNLREGSVGQIRYQASAGCVLDDAVLNDTLRQLESWASDPRGYRVRCVVMADRQMPQSFLEMIGHEFFKGSSISADTAGQESAPENGTGRGLNQGVLDLRNCFHRTTALSSLFPDQTALVAAGIRRAYSQAPTDLPEHGLLLGRCGDGSRTRDVRISQSDRSRHCYTIGATGTGKSTLLHNMVLQDIGNGEGVCLIDPHGDLFHQVLRSVPEERAKDVILMDLCDFDHVIGLNFLECDGPYKSMQMNFIINELMVIFHRLYDMEKAGGPMFEMYMRNALLLVMDSDVRKATLLDVVRVFEDEEFRCLAKSQCRNAMAVSFWDNQAEKAGRDLSLENIAPYITSKLNQFTHNALLRPIIGQPASTVDFRQIMDSGKILLINLSKGLLGEMDVQLIGMLLMGKIFNAAMGRINQAPEKRRPFYLYVDEFQNFTTPTIASLLSEARKFGLYLTLANQNLGQLSSSEKNRGIMDTVLGNVATTLFFRMGPRDAAELEAYTKPYLDSYGMQYLPDYHVACRLLNRNVPSPPFVFTTLPPQSAAVSPEAQERIVENIRRNSRQQYAVPRERVEGEIMKRWAMSDKDRDTAKVRSRP